MRNLRIIGALGALFLALVPWAGAEVPELIGYQGRLLDGTNLVNGPVTVVFRLYTQPTEGTARYTETQTVTAVDGLFAAYIGMSNAVPGSLATVFSNTTVFLELETDGTLLTPRERLASTAFALTAGAVAEEAVTTVMLADGAVAGNKVDWPSMPAGLADGDDVGLTAEADPVFSASAAASVTDAGSGTVMSGAERTKLAGIEAAADVTDAGNVEAAGAVMGGDAAGGGLTGTYPNPGISDGAGSGLDADLLDGLQGAHYLRSDVNDSFTSGTLSISAGTTLDVNGTFFAEDIYVGRNSGTDDDYIRFDGTAEYLMWDESATKFVFSDDLACGLLTATRLEVGTTHLSGQYNNIGLGRVPASGEMNSGEDLFIGFDLEVGDDLCLSKKLYMEGADTTGQDGDQSIYFYEDNSRTGEYLRWQNTADRFSLSDDLYVSLTVEIGDNLFIGGSSSLDDDYIYFDAATEHLRWDESGDYFFFSSGLVAGNITAIGNILAWGDLNIIGTITKGGGGFKIDHPLDPTNQFLYHSFVESPDMKNIYDGVAQLDESGQAVVELPEWFEALNRDFRYQLTCIGGYAPVYISEKISKNRFTIAGGAADMEISWQVTGIRQDAFANAHRLPVEEEKPAPEQGVYLYPELYGQAPRVQGEPPL